MGIFKELKGKEYRILGFGREFGIYSFGWLEENIEKFYLFICDYENIRRFYKDR